MINLKMILDEKKYDVFGTRVVIYNASWVLELARKILSNKSAWTKKAYALDSNGNKLNPNEFEKADCLCAVGAVQLAGINNSSGRIIGDAQRYLDAQVLGGIEAYNDRKSTTHKRVLNLFDRAISCAKMNEER